MPKIVDPYNTMGSSRGDSARLRSAADNRRYAGIARRTSGNPGPREFRSAVDYLKYRDHVNESPSGAGGRGLISGETSIRMYDEVKRLQG